MHHVFPEVAIFRNSWALTWDDVSRVSLLVRGWGGRIYMLGSRDIIYFNDILPIIRITGRHNGGIFLDDISALIGFSFVFGIKCILEL